MSSGDTPKPFHERFDIEVGADEARVRFVNRVSNLVFTLFMNRNFTIGDQQELRMIAASSLGQRYSSKSRFENYVQNDFRRCLQVLETLYEELEDTSYGTELANIIDSIVSYSETDIGVSWQPPIFVPTGVPLLDKQLVNEPLRWLSEPKYKSVYGPFSKGLSQYLEATNKPERLADVVTDMHEAVEALAKIVTGRPRKDLSANAESFISQVKASGHYKSLLKDYIAYANEFRHAEQEGKPRPALSEAEVESFIYMTGLFLRLVVRTT